MVPQDQCAVVGEVGLASGCLWRPDHGSSSNHGGCSSREEPWRRAELPEKGGGAWKRAWDVWQGVLEGQKDGRFGEEQAAMGSGNGAPLRLIPGEKNREQKERDGEREGEGQRAPASSLDARTCGREVSSSKDTGGPRGARPQSVPAMTKAPAQFKLCNEMTIPPQTYH
jgi:hypothetical protein